MDNIITQDTSAGKIRCSNAYIEIYPDDANFETYKRNIETNYDYVCILHDKDVTELGELKKPHYHYLIKVTGQTSLSTISYVTQVPLNYIKARSDYKFAFRYLLHLDQPEKYRYDVGEIEGVDVKARLAKYCKDNECDTYGKVIACIAEVCETNKCASITQVVTALINRGLFGYYRQAQSTFMEVWRDLRGTYMKPMKGEECDEF